MSGVTEPIDLHHLDERIIGCYVLETQDGPALFDCGPTTCIPHLKAGLAERGLDLTDIRHLLLSHIHLDHAGAAGVLVRQHPWLQVHVSEIGAPHLVDPSKLEASARRLYGPSFDSLWGELAPIPERNVHVVGDRILGLECFPTPGHAWHHVSYLDADGTLYAGDAAGVRIAPGSFVMPPCPPPEIDLEAWEQTIDEIERRTPGRLALIHFGTFDDVQEHLAALRETLHTWASRVEDGMDEQTFIAAARYDAVAGGARAHRPVRRGRPVLAPLPGPRSLLEEEAGNRERPPAEHQSVNACASRSPIEANSSAEACVASRTTGGATPASSASFQRSATTHQRSPGRSPGNIHCGCGVTRSLPRDTENSRNSSVMTAQMTWNPGSLPVRQYPSR